MKPGYKQTEVGAIPEDWNTAQIGALITDISMGPFGSDIKVSNFVSSGIPVLNGSNVAGEKLSDAFTNFVTSAKANSLKKAVARKGDIVVTHRGTLGQISYIPEDSAFDRYVISQSQFRVRFSDKHVTPEWVVRYFHSEKGSSVLLEGKGHTGVPALAQPTKTFRNLPIPLPTLPEQRAIAEALSDVDGLLGGLDRLIAKKRDLKQAAMQQLLTAQTRLPGFHGEWAVSTVGREFEIQLGKMLDAERNFGIPKPYVGNRAVQWDRIDLTDLPTVPMTPEDLGRYRLRDGDLLVCEGGDVGRAAIWKSSIECYYQKALHRLRPLRGYDPRLMAAFLRLWSERGVFANYVTQTSIAHLPREKFMEMPLPVPPPAEQTAIAEVLGEMDGELAALERRREKTRALKQAMMQQLLTGQTRLL